MWAYILRRLAFLATTLVMVAALIFGITALLPTDAAQAQLGLLSTPENLQFVRHELGLDQPLYLRFFTWLNDAGHGDFGTSLAYRTEIGPIVVARLTQSGVLAAAVLLVCLPVGVVLGLWAGARRNSSVDRLISTLTLTSFSLPDFVWAVVLIYIFASRLGILPAASLVNGSVLSDPQVLVLPALTVTLVVLAQTVRMMRQGTIEVLNQDYIRTARLKGLPEWRVFRRHVLGNALPAAVTVTGSNVAVIFGSLAVVETIFSYPGIGSLIVFAANQRDVPLLAASVLFAASIACAANLVADVVVVALNPRLRKG